MNTKKFRIISYIACIILVCITFASLFVTAGEKQHHCTGDDCPVCACIQQAEHILKNLQTSVDSALGVNLIIVLAIFVLINKDLCVLCDTLVSRKVRLDN